MTNYEKKIVDSIKREATKLIQNENVQTAAGIGVVIALGILAKKYNLPITAGLSGGKPVVGLSSTSTPNGGSNLNNGSFGTLRQPITDNEYAIKAIYESARRMSYSGDKINAAKKICDIFEAIEPGCDHYADTKAYTIAAMSKISDGISYSGDKERVNSYITKIAVGKR